jgi:hypothetical protein
MIKLAQDWSPTRWAEPDLHDWDMFIRPRELERILAEQGHLEQTFRLSSAWPELRHPPSSA